MILAFDAIVWHQFFFVMFALLTCGFAVGVLFSGNIVRMAFYLVLSLASSAGLFFLAGAEFVGAMQLMIYVGGTLVLLIFGVMLTAQDRFISLKTPAGEWVLSLVIGGTLLSLLLAAAFRYDKWQQPSSGNATPTSSQADTTARLGLSLVGIRPDRLDEDGKRTAGMSGYLFPFIIVSVHLLVVLVGAAYMARAKKRMTTNAR
ncbi:MAG: NADH-quinone oxidoreductase subunit J [Planctomycetota bacterium]|nr:NADH-quinone oxidoreductase subunit J [Planctomycetota bacterium]